MGDSCLNKDKDDWCCSVTQWRRSILTRWVNNTKQDECVKKGVSKRALIEMSRQRAPSVIFAIHTLAFVVKWSGGLHFNTCHLYHCYHHCIWYWRNSSKCQWKHELEKLRNSSISPKKCPRPTLFSAPIHFLANNLQFFNHFRYTFLKPCLQKCQVLSILKSANNMICFEISKQ